VYISGIIIGSIIQLTTIIKAKETNEVMAYRGYTDTVEFGFGTCTEMHSIYWMGARRILENM